jgi:hypothetical protein
VRVYEKKRILVVVKTYPNPSHNYGERSAALALTWIRDVGSGCTRSPSGRWQNGSSPSTS